MKKTIKRALLSVLVISFFISEISFTNNLHFFQNSSGKFITAPSGGDTYYQRDIAPETDLKIYNENPPIHVDIIVAVNSAEDSEAVKKAADSLTKKAAKRGYNILLSLFETGVRRVQRTEEITTTYSSSPPSSYSYNQGGFSGTLTLYNSSSRTVYDQYETTTRVPVTRTIKRIVPNNSSDDELYSYNKAEKKWDLKRSWNASNPVKAPQEKINGQEIKFKRIGTNNNSPELPDPNDPKLKDGQIFRKTFGFEGVFEGTYTEYEDRPSTEFHSYEEYTAIYRGNVTKTTVPEYIPNNRQVEHRGLFLFGMDKNSDITDVQKYCDPVVTTSAASVVDLKRKIFEYMDSLPRYTPLENSVLVGEKIHYNITDKSPNFNKTEVKSINIDHDETIFETGKNKVTFIPNILPHTFRETGRYSIEREIKMAGNKSPDMTASANLLLHVHNHPNAEFSVYPEFRSGEYDIEIESSSFDPDFESSTDRGIKYLIYKYKEANDRYWIHRIPKVLKPGKYEISLIAVDHFGARSPEYIETLQLDANPTAHINAKISTDNSITKAAYPAGSAMKLHSISSIYHGSHNLKIIGQGINKYLAFSNAKRSPKRNSMYLWPDQYFTIPETAPDGSFGINISAERGVKSLSVNVFTPIELEAKIEGNGPMNFIAHTNKYVKKVSVKAFEGTKYERTTNLAKTVDSWNATIAPNDVPEGEYNFTFTAETAAGKKKSITLRAEYSPLEFVSKKITGGINRWNTTRYMGYEKVTIEAEMSKKCDEVLLEFSPELMAMKFVNSKGQTYYYRDEIGREVKFPIKMYLVTNDKKQHSGDGAVKDAAKSEGFLYTAEYILPLANSTLDWKNTRQREAYSAIITAKMGKTEVKENIDDIDLTGNIHDLIYIKPEL